MTVLSFEQVAGYAYGAGFRGGALVIATAITTPESGRIPDRVSEPNRDGSIDRGLWQINSVHSQYDPQKLLDPAYNARAAYEVSSGGTNWTPWTSYKAGKHLPFMGDAQAAAATIEARGGVFDPAPGTGTTSPGGGTPAVITPDVLPPAPPVIDLESVAPSTWDDYRIEGLAGGTLYDGNVELATTEASQVELSFEDPGWKSYKAGHAGIGARVAWRDLDLQVGTEELGDTDGVERFTFSARSRAVEVLRTIEQIATAGIGMSPTQVLQTVCADPNLGLRFYGKGTATGAASINQKARKDGTQGNESLWEAANRWAEEQGFWLFESAGALWFAPPSWIVDKTTRVRVGWQGSWGDPRLDAWDPPQCRRVHNSDGTITTEITVKLPRGIGEQVRPGMGIDLRGVDEGGVRGPLLPPKPSPIQDAVGDVVGALNGINPGLRAIVEQLSGFATRRLPVNVPFDGLYIVDSVKWDYDGATAPVEVRAQRPIDPVPTGDNAQKPFTGAPLGTGGRFPGPDAPFAHLVTDWGTFEYVAAVGRYVRDTFHPHAIGGYRPTDPFPDHPSRKAIDFMVDADRALGDRINSFLLTIPFTRYTIWFNQTYHPDGTVKPYTHGTDVTTRHENHVHWLAGPPPP